LRTTVDTVSTASTLIIINFRNHKTPVSSFWSFVTSVSTPDFAGKAYGFIVAASRIGGMVTTILAWAILQYSYLPSYISISTLVLVSAILLLFAAAFLFRIIKSVPREDLHGYEAAYKASIKKKNDKKSKAGVFEGLRLMVAEPYVLGLFLMMSFFEIINIVFDYKMEVLMSISTGNSVHDMSKFMLFYTFSFQALSFFLALFGTTFFLRFVGVRLAIFVMPVSIIVLSLFLLISPSLSTIFIVLVVSRALNYGFNNPIREVLYVPTIKDVQFKSKAWIDSFGRTISKSSGSIINFFTAFQSIGVQSAIMFSFVISISWIWLAIGYFMGKKYSITIEDNEVIGFEISDKGNEEN